MHSLVGPKVTILHTLNFVRLAWLWPKECSIHPKLKDALADFANGKSDSVRIFLQLYSITDFNQ